jgi:hypothetical protein
LISWQRRQKAWQVCFVCYTKWFHDLLATLVETCMHCFQSLSLVSQASQDWKRRRRNRWVP